MSNNLGEPALHADPGQLGVLETDEEAVKIAFAWLESKQEEGTSVSEDGTSRGVRGGLN
jgi:hypothetical protein